MPAAIIGGTGIYDLPGLDLRAETIKTPYGEARVQRSDNLVFLARHSGPEAPNQSSTAHSLPPHRINYRANIKALHMLGVRRVCGAFAVGMINPDANLTPPVIVSDFIDMTSGRDHTFFDALNTQTVKSKSQQIMGHVDMSQPFCLTLRGAIYDAAKAKAVRVTRGGVYVCTNGPRFETPAEIRAYRKMGADIVGMTLCPEVPLALEAGMSYAALALPLNWAAGIKPDIVLQHQDLKTRQAEMTALMIQALTNTEDRDCRPAKMF